MKNPNGKVLSWPMGSKVDLSKREHFVKLYIRRMVNVAQIYEMKIP